MRCCGSRRFAAIVVLVAVGSASAARAQTGPFRSVDPYDVQRPAGGAPTVFLGPSWPADPFGVGYSLLGGYRRVVSGARQPIGHEHLQTGPNSYVYRPVYAADGGRWPDGGSRRLPPGFGPIIVDYPGTVHERRYAPGDGGAAWTNADVSSRTAPQMSTPVPGATFREF